MTLDKARLTAVDADIHYVAPSEGRPVYTLHEPGPYRKTAPPASRKVHVPIYDCRPAMAHTDLNDYGFGFTRDPLPQLDYFSPTDVQRAYYPICQSLVSRLSGCTRVVAFDHNVRDAHRNGETGVDVPVLFAHSDFTDTSSVACIQGLVGAEANALLDGRYAMINVWRPLIGPIEDMPLAICDARTIADDDLIRTDFVYTDRVGEIYSLQYAESHEWYFLDGMQADEVLLFKCYDSDPSATARCAAHTAFRDPRVATNVAPRQSIEVRTVAFFD